MSEEAACRIAMLINTDCSPTGYLDVFRWHDDFEYINSSAKT